MKLLSPTSEFQRLRIATIILCIALFSGMLISWKLWLTNHLFPLTPVLPFLEKTPNTISIALLIVIFALTIFTIINQRQKIIQALFFLLVIEVLIDQNRLQPWFYQYTLMFFLLMFYGYKKPNEKSATNILHVFRLVVCGIYFWSGMQKLNTDYFNDTAFWLMEPMGKYFGSAFAHKLGTAAGAIPYFEICLAFGLLIPKTRKYFLIPGILMHAYIILLMTPLGRNYNYVIIPWNGSMILFLLLLFNKSNRFNFSETFKSVKTIPQKIVFALFWIMPSLSFFDKWDSYLSSSLYCGNSDNAYLYLKEEQKKSLPDELQKMCQFDSTNQTDYLYINNWSMLEMNVPAYPEKRIFTNAKKKIDSYLKASEQNSLMLIEHKTILTERKKNEMVEN